MEGRSPIMECPRDTSDDDDYFEASIFVDESYVTRDFILGPHIIKVLCLQSASTDYDLTGQLVWPGAELLNDYLVARAPLLEGLSVIELGSGVGLTGLLCAHFCHQVVMTDHNATVLKVMERNVKLQRSFEGGAYTSNVDCEELEWGNEGHMAHIQDRYPLGFDLILGADILVTYQQNSIPLLFTTVKNLMTHKPVGTCTFVLAYVSRANSNDAVLMAEARKHKVEVIEVPGTRKQVAGGAHEGVVYEISLRPG